MEFITHEQMYAAWKKVADAVESGKMQVNDVEVKAALDTLNTVISGTLSTSDIDTQQAIADLLDKLESGIDVTDADTKAELEAVKAKLEAIETRLDESFDVKLTGSNVAYIGSHRNVAITAGSRTNLISSDIAEPSLSFLIRSDSSHNFRIDIDWSVAINSPAGTFSGIIYGESKTAESEGMRWMGKKVETLGNRATILLVNNDAEDHNYDVDMYGIRG